MSFAVWKSRPPFTFAPDDREQIYPVGDVWVVTDDPARATQAEIDAVLEAAPPVTPTPVKQLAALLVEKNIVSAEEIDALTLEQGPA